MSRTRSQNTPRKPFSRMRSRIFAEFFSMFAQRWYFNITVCVSSPGFHPPSLLLPLTFNSPLPLYSLSLSHSHPGRQAWGDASRGGCFKVCRVCVHTLYPQSLENFPEPSPRSLFASWVEVRMSILGHTKKIPFFCFLFQVWLRVIQTMSRFCSAPEAKERHWKSLWVIKIRLWELFQILHHTRVGQRTTLHTFSLRKVTLFAVVKFSHTLSFVKASSLIHTGHFNFHDC